MDRDGKSPVILAGVLIAGLIGMTAYVIFQTIDNVKDDKKWYDYNVHEIFVAGSGAILGTVVFMTAAEIATAVLPVGQVWLS